jgi:hypothetical protein
MANTKVPLGEIPNWVKSYERIQNAVQIIAEPTQMSQLLRTWEQVVKLSCYPSSTVPPWIESTQRMAEALKPAVAVCEQLPKIEESVIRAVQLQQEMVSKLGLTATFWNRISDQVNTWVQSIDAATIGESFSQQEQFQIIDTIEKAIKDDEFIHTEQSEPIPISQEDQQIVADEVTGILSSEKNWDKRLAASVQKCKEKNPTVSKILILIFWQVLVPILVNLMSNFIGQTLSPAKIYESPQTSSSVICTLPENQLVAIVGDEPYYFKVRISNDTGDQDIIGYVSKRSIVVHSSEELQEDSQSKAEE